ncbi:MAG: RNA polymerase sigma factor [Candidatus Kerfeldbacteria bacterium]|nr:RNA polymerase sigma factor [Candidatus Kerfeldbacteria bacterium]
MTLQEKQTIFEAEYPALFDYAYRYVAYRVPNNNEAEDIVSEGFLKAYKQLHQYTPEKGNLRQWITGIMRYAIIDYWRIQRITIELNEALLLIDAADTAHIEQTIDNRLLVDQLMERLSPEMKAMFALRYIDGLTYAEIATLMNKQPDAVRKFFSRMHNDIRLEMEEQYG